MSADSHAECEQVARELVGRIVSIYPLGIHASGEPRERLELSIVQALADRESENEQRIAELEATVERSRTATESDCLRVVRESRDFILHEFCLLQIKYGEQKHEIRNLKATIEAQAQPKGAL